MELGGGTVRKSFRAAAIISGLTIAALILSVSVSCVLFPRGYVFRCIVNREGKTTDYLLFPERTIAKSAAPYHYRYSLDSTLADLDIQYAVKGQLQTKPLGSLAESNDTTSLIVVHDDTVVYESYFNGSTKDSTNTSFSMAKSIDSLLIGMAIDDGFIRSEFQPITDFVPELAGTEFADITIRDLLMMRSRIAYREGGLWFGDDAKTYYYPDLRDLALNHLRADIDYSGQFLYNNYHPLLLGIILERSTGMSVSQYFREQIWDTVGAENDASWSLDSEASGFEKMESGLNFRSLDFAKIGSMVLHRGEWNGQTCISEDWLDRSLVAETPLDQSGIGYQYMWWSLANEKGGYDYFAHGNHGQYLYVSPENDTVIVRTGTEEGEIGTWIGVLYQVAAYAGSKQ
jgi:CubicO group peptidase (beta-lactamase class C family)